jgi:hypothetical protein
MVEKWSYNIANATAYTDGPYRNLSRSTGCANASEGTLECLRALPIAQLSAGLNVSYPGQVFSGTGLGPWLTTVDGNFLPYGSSESMAGGHFNHNVMILYTRLTDEASVFLFGGPTTRTLTSPLV